MEETGADQLPDDEYQALIQPPKGSAQDDGCCGTRHLRNLHLLSVSFLFVFLAYGATQNLESSINSAQNLGSVSLGVLYLSFTICSIGAPLPVRWLGSKAALLLGLSGYWIFMFANLFPSWYTMIPASLFLGFSAALLWVAEGTYITHAAKSHAAEMHMNEGSTIGKFNGEFWSFFASHQVIGNLLTWVLLNSGKEDSATQNSTSTWPLLLTFLGCMTVGTVIACCLDSQTDTYKQKNTLRMEPSLADLAKSTFVLLLDRKLQLLLPLLVYSGLQQAFIWGDFTESVVTPALGISYVGGVMAAFGAVDAGFSLLAGRLSAGISSVSSIVFFGAAAQLFALVWLILKRSYQPDMEGYFSIFSLAMIWGLGDAAFNTQISAILGILYPDITESAFAQWKIWQSAATAVVFFITSYTSLYVRLVVLLGAWSVFMISFLMLRFICGNVQGKTSIEQFP